METEFPQVFALALTEKLQLLEELWDSIADSPEQVPALEWQKEELQTRKEHHAKNPDAVVSWEEARERIRSRRG